MGHHEQSQSSQMHAALGTTLVKQQQKSEQEEAVQEVAALDDFVAVVSKEKTRSMIEGIKLRRRAKHIEAL